MNSAPEHDPGASSSAHNDAGSSSESSGDIGSPDSPSQGGSGWTFLSNHMHVLLCTRQRGDITAREIADLVGITERAVQRILADLIHAGYLTREKRGRQNVYTIQSDKHLRHPLERHCEIGGLLEFLTTGRAESAEGV
jgi:hypothetical protein